MKSLLVNILILSSLNAFSQSVIQLESTYQGKNLFIQNPFLDNDVGYCIYKIEVNERVITAVNPSESMEIKLDDLGFKVDDPFLIKLYHRDGCSPKVLNAEYFGSKQSKVDSATIDNGFIRWKSNGKNKYHVEQYRWNKWIAVEATEVTQDGNGFSLINVSNEMHSGTNVFRVVAKDSYGKKNYSNRLTIEGPEEALTWQLNKGNREVKFSAKTRFELYDEYGKLLQIGTNEFIDLTKTFRKIYYLNFDNTTTKIELI